MKQEVLVETAFQTPSFPSERKMAQSMIGECLEKMGRYDFVQKYGLECFEVKVQSITRTFIDKLFALVDYKLTGKCDEHSRHLYDLHCLFIHVDFNNQFRKLFLDVREIRKDLPYCPSAQDTVSLIAELHEIIENDIYKYDYISKTENMIYGTETYFQAIETLRKIISELVLLEIE